MAHGTATNLVCSELICTVMVFDKFSDSIKKGEKRPWYHHYYHDLAEYIELEALKTNNCSVVMHSVKV
jgi:hypothetical protein